MARTIQEIQTQIINEKNKYASLAQLDSQSQTAIWRLWIYITAVAIYIHEQIFDNHKNEVDARLRAARVTTPAWLIEQCYAFQVDDSLVIDENGNIGYSTIDEDAKIVNRASYQETSGGTITLKVAKAESETGSTAIALSNGEISQFKSYIEQIKPAGTAINVLSLNADELILSGATVYYDALYDLDDLKESVNQALYDYMDSLDFNAVVYKNEVIDAIQNVEGVVDITIDNLILRQGISDTTVIRRDTPTSGYLNESDDNGFKFLETITYEAEN